MLNSGERQVAPTVDGIRRDHVARYEWAARHISAAGPGKTVIDFACGIGYGTQIISKAGHLVTGCDVSEESLNYALEHYAHTNAQYCLGDGNNPPLIKADVGVCFETIEHINDPRPLLRALADGCKILFASVPNEEVFPWKNYKFHFRHYTRAEFAELLRECGWRAVGWYGQEGPESEVEPNVNGRTLIAVCQSAPLLGRHNIPAPPKAPPLPPPVTAMRPAFEKPAAPDHVAILGMGPSLDQYTGLAKRAGGRRAYCNETWGINAVADVITCDRVFHMDDVRIQEIRAAAKPDSNIAKMLAWLKTHPGPVYTSRANPNYPGLVEYPLEDVLNALPPFGYFNSTAAYAVAFAIFLGVKKISLFGFDFTYPNAHHAEKGRACVEFWLGVAVTKGITVSMGNASSLMDACEPQQKRLYGYDCADVAFGHHPDGRVAVTYTERATLPTAEEIEAAYDHSAHPNPLVAN